MQWAPNPYTLARLLNDQPDIEPLYTATGTRADDFLKDAFLYGGKHKTMADALAVFQRISENEAKPLTLADALSSPYVKEAAEEYREDKIRRVLPSLLQISDESFDGHLFAEADQLVAEDVNYLDPVQGALGNCYLIAAMTALAWAKPELLQSCLGNAGFSSREPRSFTWKFHKADDESAGGGQSTVSGRIPMAGKLPRYAHSKTREEYWPALIEKAYVSKKQSAIAGNPEPTPASYQAIYVNGTFPQYACQALVGGTSHVDFVEANPSGEIFQRGGDLHEPSGVMSRPVMASTINNLGPDNRELWENTGLWPNHAYALLGVMDRGQVVLRNPHGIATKNCPGYEQGPWQVGDRSVELNLHGVFAISRELFKANFKTICWVDVG